jgi:hypothetical protein
MCSITKNIFCRVLLTSRINATAATTPACPAHAHQRSSEDPTGCFFYDFTYSGAEDETAWL